MVEVAAKPLRNFTLCTLHFAFVFAAVLSGVAKTFDIDVSTGRPSAANVAYYHGETIEFRAVRGRSVVTNVEYSCIYYHTNGMGDVWWKTDGLTFHPTNDVGASSYRFFLEGRDDVGRDWHANGLLRLLDSPGFEPSAVQLPVQTLDFSRVEVLNAPWAEIGERATGNRERIEALETNVYTKAETESKIVELAPAPGNYAAVSNAAMNAVQPQSMTNYATRAQLDAGWWSEWTVYQDGVVKPGWTVYRYDDMWWVANPSGEPWDSVGAPEDASYVVFDNTEFGFVIERHRVAAPVPTKPEDIGAQAALTFDTVPTANSSNPVTSGGIMTALDGKAPVADTTLTPLFSQWTLGGMPNGWSVVQGPSYVGDNRWELQVTNGSVFDSAYDEDASETARTLLFPFSGELLADVDATRSVVGYQLGSQSDKPLQPQGDYAPATNIQKAALAQGVQTSLGLADTAVQPADLAATNPNFSNAVLQVGLGIDTNTVAAINALVEAGDELPIGGATTVGALLLALAAAVAALRKSKADASALRYALVTLTTGQMQDRAVQNVTLNAASTTLVLPALTDLSGKVADFGIDMVNAYTPEVDGTPTPTAASFQLDGTLGTNYNLIVPKGETWSDMTALEAGEMASFYFTRSAFQRDNVPTWEVVKKVVEFVPVPAAP